MILDFYIFDCGKNRFQIPRFSPKGLNYENMLKIAKALTVFTENRN